MTESLTTTKSLAPPVDARLLEKVLLGGDLAELTPAQRLSYYRTLCDGLGLSPLSRPFDYLRLSGKLVLYAKRDATDQLRAARNISMEITSRELVGKVYIVTAKATTPAGRTDESTGVVSVVGLKKEALSNAMMKAETKAKRRATLSLCGLGLLDESEIESVAGARRVQVDAATGEILEPRSPALSGTSAPATDSKTATRITPAQRRALFQEARTHGITDEQLVAWLSSLGFTSSAEITVDQYDNLRAAVASGAVAAASEATCRT